MALLRNMRFWKKSSKASSRQAPPQPSEVANSSNDTVGADHQRHAPAARGSALFQEFLTRPADLGPAFTQRLALVSALEERRAQMGGSGYIPVEYVSRPFPDAPASPWAVKSVDSFDLADVDVIEEVDGLKVTSEDATRDLIAIARQKQSPELEPESQSDSSFPEIGFEGETLPEGINGRGSNGRFDVPDLASTLALGLITAGILATTGAPSTGNGQRVLIRSGPPPVEAQLKPGQTAPSCSSSLSSSKYDPGAIQISFPFFPSPEAFEAPEPSDSRRTSSSAANPPSWTAGDDAAENFHVISAVPANGNAEFVASREGSVSSTGGQSECHSSAPASVAPSFDEYEQEMEQEMERERGRDREPGLLNPGVYY